MSGAAELPRYKCHKEVSALKIGAVGYDANDCALLTPEDQRFYPINVDGLYMEKHKPEAGGYYVVYADGYKSFSPAEAFESDYTRI